MLEIRLLCAVFSRNDFVFKCIRIDVFKVGQRKTGGHDFCGKLLWSANFLNGYINDI